MNKKIVWSAFVFVLSLSTVLGTIWSSGLIKSASPRTWTVGPEGPPRYDFAKIQDAIDNYGVKDGDDILVALGTYKENITIDKSLNLTGVNGSEVTVIDAGGMPTEVAVTITSSNVRVENFTIEGPEKLPRVGIRIINNLKPIYGIVIHKNHIIGVDYGIDCGIYTDPDYVLDSAEITENTISWPEFTGIFVENGTNLNVSKNTFLGLAGATLGLEAITLHGVNGSVICENNISSSKRGMDVRGYFNNITDNTITEVMMGMSVSGSFNNIDHNTIRDFEEYGIDARAGIQGSNVTDCMIHSGRTGISGGYHVSGNDVRDCTTGVENADYVSGNDIRECTTGVMTRGYGNTVNNFFRNCEKGVVMSRNFSDVASNIFLSCPRGVYIFNGTNGNVIYHNMFLNSTAADNSEEFANSWDNGTIGGNYWFDYECEDFDGDGFGDTPYIIYNVYRNETTNRDNYPLIIPPRPIPVFWKVKDHSVVYEVLSYCVVHGNVTVSYFDVDEQTKLVSLNGTGHGYCNLTFSTKFLHGSFKIFVNDTQAPWISLWNQTHTSIYFEIQTSIPLSVEIEAQIKLACDVNGDEKIDIRDIASVAKEYDKELIQP